MLDGMPLEPTADIPEEQVDESLPRIRKDLIIEEAGQDEHGNPIWNVLDSSRNTFFRLSFHAFEALRYWHNHENIDSLLGELKEKSIIDINKEEIKDFILFLRSNNLVQAYTEMDLGVIQSQFQKTQKSIVSKTIHGYLFVKIPLVYPDKFLNKTYPWVKHLASQYFLAFLVFCAVVGGYLVVRQYDEFTNSLVRFFNLEGMLYYFMALVIAKISHELGHAYATKSAGQRVSSMGMAFLVMFPILYTDTTNVWRVRSKKKRLEIAAAGMLVELSIAIISLLVWSFLEDGAIRSAVFLLATVTWIMTLAVNLNPLMRFDGYYLLQDWLGVDNLQTKGFAHAKWYMREKLFGFKQEVPELITKKQHKWFLIYSYSTWIYRFFLFLGIASLVYYFFFKLLGIFLFIVEIVWFIGRPIYLELKTWWGMRSVMKLNKHTVVSSLVLIGLLVLIIVPWKTGIVLHSVYQAEKYERIYNPKEGQIKRLTVKDGDVVKEGDLLLVVKNEESSQKYQEVLLSIMEKKIRQQAQTANQNNSSTALILSQEIQTLYQELNGLRKEVDLNSVKAKFNGKVYDINKDLTVGTWLSAKQLVMQIIEPGPGKVVGFVLEQDFDKISRGLEGMFYPQSLSYKPFAVKIQSISQSNAQSLEAKPLASVYGGEIAVRAESSNRGRKLVPEEAIYEVTLVPVDKENRWVLRDQVGVVTLDGERQNFVSRVWRQIGSVLVRESGF